MQPIETCRLRSTNTRLDPGRGRHRAARRGRRLGPAARLFALVETADLLRREPQLAGELGIGAAPTRRPHPGRAGRLPAHQRSTSCSAGIAWPPRCSACALAVERLMLPPDAERAACRRTRATALRWVAEHPERQEVGIVVAVLRDGSRAARCGCAPTTTRQSVLTGPDLVPGTGRRARPTTLAD